MAIKQIKQVVYIAQATCTRNRDGMSKSSGVSLAVA